MRASGIQSLAEFEIGYVAEIAAGGQLMTFRVALRDGGFLEGVIPNGASLRFKSMGEIGAITIATARIDRTLRPMPK